MPSITLIVKMTCSEVRKRFLPLWGREGKWQPLISGCTRLMFRGGEGLSLRLRLPVDPAMEDSQQTLTHSPSYFSSWIHKDGFVNSKIPLSASGISVNIKGLTFSLKYYTRNANK